MKQTITLTYDEIKQLIQMTDPRQCARVIDELDSETTDELDEADYADAHPMALCIARKIQRKAKAAEKRRLKKLSREQQKKEEVPESIDSDDLTFEIIQPDPDSLVTLELNEATVGRLLWLKQNNKAWCRAVNFIISEITGCNVPARLTEQIMILVNRLFSYLNPLINQAAKHHLTPRNMRQRYAVC